VFYSLAQHDASAMRNTMLQLCATRRSSPVQHDASTLRNSMPLPCTTRRFCLVQLRAFALRRAEGQPYARLEGSVAQGWKGQLRKAATNLYKGNTRSLNLIEWLFTQPSR